jgi:hypothetical protein
MKLDFGEPCCFYTSLSWLYDFTFIGAYYYNHIQVNKTLIKELIYDSWIYHFVQFQFHQDIHLYRLTGTAQAAYSCNEA